MILDSLLPKRVRWPVWQMIMDNVKIESTQLSVRFIGTATAMVRCGMLPLLTDPNFIHKHEQVSTGHGRHAAQLSDPAMEIEQLPVLGLVWLAQSHGDRCDQVAEPENLQVVDPAQAIPIHDDIYDVFKSPLEDFVEPVKPTGLSDRVGYLRRGESWNCRCAGTQRETLRQATTYTGRT